MHHYITFLRGINLGKRRVKMDRLRVLFEELKFSDVESFIASGNLIFSSKAANSKQLETQIQSHLKESLGYEVETFVRTRAEVATIAKFRFHKATNLERYSDTIHVGFLRDSLSPDQISKFLACQTAEDELRVAGREYYWLCRVKSHESKVWSSPQMKAVKLPSSSVRNLTTVRKLAALYPAPDN